MKEGLGKPTAHISAIHLIFHPEKHAPPEVSLNSNSQAFPNNLRSCRLWELPETVREENCEHRSTEACYRASTKARQNGESLFVYRVWALASIPSASIKKRKSCASLSKFNLISPDFVRFYFLSSCIMTKRSNPHLWKLLNFCYIE